MALDTLDAQPTETLIELFFESEEPDERDALFEAIAGRDGAKATAFFAAVLAHDEDPYLQVAAARALRPGMPAEAQQRLRDVIVAGGDEVLFEEALSALLEHPTADALTFVRTLVEDVKRDSSERRLAFVALMQMDEAAAQLLCRERLSQGKSSPSALLGEPLDLIGTMLTALVRIGDSEDRNLIAALMATLPPRDEAQDDDVELFRDVLLEALAVMDGASDAPTTEGP